MYHIKYKMPVRRLPGNMPAILPGEVDEWLVQFDEIKKNERG